MSDAQKLLLLESRWRNHGIHMLVRIYSAGSTAVAPAILEAPSLAEGPHDVGNATWAAVELPGNLAIGLMDDIEVD